MKSNYDVVVVGADPAGSTAARLLGENNVDLLLVEKEQPPATRPAEAASPTRLYG